MNGISGGSGFFSNIKDMTTFMQLMIGKGKYKYYARVFSEAVVDLFTKKVSQKYANTRALGWDTVPASNPPCGKKFSQNSFGISDISGSYIWGDKDKEIAIVLLANGNFPAAHPAKDVNIWQGNLSDAIMTALGY